MSTISFRTPPTRDPDVNFSAVVPLKSEHRRMTPLAYLREAWRRQRSRGELARLDERMLKDIGVTPTDALFEASKPFWIP